MKIGFIRGAFYFIVRYGTDERDPLGFVIKPRSAKTFSEREGYRQGFDIGSVYFRTYRRSRRT